MTKTLPISEARQNLPKLVERARKMKDEYIITVNGKPAAVILSIEKFEIILQSRTNRGNLPKS